MLEQDLRLVGLVALHDPLRATAAPAVAEARSAGLRVEMVTGDHPRTAAAIGRVLDLPEGAIHARVTPAEKLGSSSRCRPTAKSVALTGDGVNDAPALRRADVGVAMGRSGTEAAREAADLVLTDDDFATIVAAIREGRAIGDNIRKFVAFLLSANLGEVALFAIADPRRPRRADDRRAGALVNILTDGLPAIALTRDPAAPDTMRRPPERGDRLFPPRAWGALAAVGVLVAFAALAAFLLGRSAGDDEAQTMAFATVASRNSHSSSRSARPFEPPGRRRAICTWSGASSSPPRSWSSPVRARPERAARHGRASARQELGIVVVLSLVPFLCVEAGKGLFRRVGWTLEGPRHDATGARHECWPAGDSILAGTPMPPSTECRYRTCPRAKRIGSRWRLGATVRT